MRYIILFLMLPFIAYPQFQGPLEEDELEDPDETQYLDQLLTTIFQPFSIETADANALLEHGYSGAAIETILIWQEGDESLMSLRRKIHGSDLILLKKDIQQDSQPTQIQLRQRIQYSPSLNGWRILNKGRFWNSWGSIMVLGEQDPGEGELTDHAIITLSSQSIPRFDNVILGDFHVSLGGGLILNQQGSRPSLLPASLIRTRQSTIRPHYSSREIDYYRGIAGNFSVRELRGTAFISSRSMKGTTPGNQFKEDGDGIHPTGRILEYRRANNIGLALETAATGIQLYGSTIYNPLLQAGIAYELGLTGELSKSQTIQVYTNSLDFKNHRIIGTWAYLTSELQVSLQYRHFISDEILAPGAISALLGSSASNEKGISVRTRLRPNQKMQIHYAFDTGLSIDVQSAHDYGVIQQHKLQVVQKLDKDIVQLDFSQKKEHPVLEGDIWAGQFSSRRLTKGALSFTHLFSGHLKYRINLKSAFQQSESAFLVQQRLSGNKGSWKWAMGYVRFSIPDYRMRLSVYETSVAESFGFYTAFDDGDRWFLYLKRKMVSWFNMELKLVQTRSFEIPVLLKQLALSFQMSVVL